MEEDRRLVGTVASVKQAYENYMETAAAEFRPANSGINLPYSAVDEMAPDFIIQCPG